MKFFRTYQLAVQFYRSTCSLKLPTHLNDQLLRASSSIALNLAEGSAKRAFPRDQKRFYLIALASLRECQAILELAGNIEQLELADSLGAHLYKLTK